MAKTQFTKQMKRTVLTFLLHLPQESSFAQVASLQPAQNAGPDFQYRLPVHIC